MDREKLRALHDLSGRVAIVTGGTRGMGRAIAEGLVASGAKVTVASRKAAACQETEDHLRTMGGEALGVPTHLGDVEAIAGLVNRTIDRFGALDIVVNNAANALALPLGRLTPDAWEKSFGVNLRGPVFLVERALPYLKDSGHGVILNMISAGAFLFSGGISMYATAKAGLMAMTRAQAATFAPFGIRSNALAPGAVDTDMMRNNSPEQQEAMKNASFMRRAADPDELAAAALFLISDASSFMTGQVLLVDGGLTPH